MTEAGQKVGGESVGKMTDVERSVALMRFLGGFDIGLRAMRDIGGVGGEVAEYLVRPLIVAEINRLAPTALAEVLGGSVVDGVVVVPPRDESDGA